jgi:hypothetical protein
MARRLVLGKAGSDYGLFVSKSGTDVVNDSGTLTNGDNLLFDSRVGIGSLPLKFHGQGTLGLPSTRTDTLKGDTFTTITHNLGYKPFVIVQWCFSTDVTSGVATKMYPAMHFYYDEYDYDIDGSREEEFNAEFKGGVWFEVSNTALKIYNNFAGGLKTAELNDVLEEQEIISPLEIKYAFLIFDVEGVDTA